MKADISDRDSHLYEFGPFRLDAVNRCLLRDGEPVTIPPKAFDTLVALVDRRGHAVRKDELIDAVWPDTFVDENNLNQYISVLRKALGENGEGHRYIVTVPRWGYRFVGDVREIDGDAEELTVSTRTRTSVVVRDEATIEPEPRSRWFVTPSVLVSTVALVIALTALVFAWGGLRPSPSASTTVVRSIAVLPFSIIDENPVENAHLEVGMADAVINRLGRLHRISVRSTSAVRRYAGAQQDPQAIGKALGVDAILDGSILAFDGRLRVTARLVSTRDGTSLWTEKFDEKISDIFLLQDAIAARVTRGLAPVLDGEQLWPTARPTESAKAYEAYLKGRHLWSKRTTESVRASIECFKAAIEEDPNFALAHVGLADAYSIQAAPLAEAALRRALELDDMIGEAHASVGFHRMFLHWDLATADHELRLAIELSPNYATAHQWYAISLAVRGRLDEAKASMARAIECDPVSPNMRADMAQICLFAGENDAAIEHCRAALELDPNFLFAHQYLFAANAQAGRYDEAVDALTRSIEIAGLELDTAAAIRQVYAASGWTGLCRWRVSKSRESRCSMAALLVETGDKERAIDELRKAYDEREFFLLFVAVDPDLAPLRTDPRFIDIARRVGVI